MKIITAFPSSHIQGQSAPWRLTDVIFSFFIGLFLSSLPPLFPGTEAEGAFWCEFFSLFLQIAGLAFTPVFLLRKLYSFRALPSLGFLPPEKAGLFHGGILGGLLLSLLNILLSSLMLWILPESLSQEQSVLLILDQANTPLKMFLVFIQLLILAPLGEELLFRAFLYPALLKRLKIWPAILLSSLIFAALHLNLAAFLPLFIGGLGFNIIYARWGNLLYCAVAHAIWNGVSLLVYFLS